MGYRLSKIYTRTGDDGSTGLGDGSRIQKDDARVECYGTVDELNSVIGMLRSHQLSPHIDTPLEKIQHDLFDLGGELSVPGYITISDQHTEKLEQQLDGWNEQLAPLDEFILPGGSAAASTCHLARTVCRRAERHATTLNREVQINPEAIKYLNRLSDLLFVLARVLNKEAGVSDVLWQRTPPPTSDL